MRKSRILVVAAVIIVVVIGAFYLSALPRTSTSLATSKATAYLVSNYDSKVGLIPESPGYHTAWLYSDNYLAAMALRQVGISNSSITAIADNITATIEYYAPRLKDATNQYMVLGSAWNGSCDFDAAGPYTVARSLNITINATLNNMTGTLPDSDYADIAFLTAICLQHQGNHGMAVSAFNLGAKMFDGVGFKDSQFTYPGSSRGQYQTYKLALYMYAGKLLSQPVNQGAVTTLLMMQGSDGGFYTGYNSDLTHGITITNTETTSLALLALAGP